MTSQPQTPEPASPEARHWLGLAVVERTVVHLRPDYTALIIVADGLRPAPSDKATDALLSNAQAQVRAALDGRVAEQLEPVTAWRQAYLAFGAKPTRTRPSVEALLRRIEDGLPRSTGSPTSTTPSRQAPASRRRGRISPGTAARPSARPAERKL